MKIEIELSDYQANVLCAAGELSDTPSAEAVTGAFFNLVMCSDELSNLFDKMADECGVEYPDDEEGEAEREG